MNSFCDLIIRNGNVFYKNKLQKVNIAIKKGKIIKISKNLNNINSKKIINAANQLIIPGVIDIHFHIRAPSFPNRGTVKSETMAAAKGGVTTLFEMPISDPCTSSPKTLKKRKEHFLKKSYINFGFISAIGKLNNNNLNGLLKEGAIAFKIFTISPPPNRQSEFDGLCFVKEEEIFRALMHAKKSNLVIIFHAEDQELLNYFKKEEKKFSKSDPRQHNATRPPITEALAISKILTINSVVNAKIHIAHVTSSSAASIISYFQKQGQDVTAETCPHYLFKSEKDVVKYHAFGKINPPIRDEKEKKALWKAINKNILTIVASDHASFNLKEKIKGVKNFSSAPPGTPGGELLLPLIMNAVKANKINLEKAINLLCKNPSKRFGLFPRKGIIEKGSDADIVIYNKNEKWKINEKNLVTKGKSCAHLYYGDTIKGKVKMTIINGEIVYDTNKFYKIKDKNLYVDSNYKKALNG